MLCVHCPSIPLLAQPCPSHLVPEGHDAGQEPNQDVCVHAPLVGLVNDDHSVLGQQEILRTGDFSTISEPGHSYTSTEPHAQLDFSHRSSLAPKPLPALILPSKTI